MGWHSGQFTGRSALQSRFLWRFPVEGSPVTAIVRANRLQPGEPVAAAGAAEGNRQVVADQLQQRLVKHARYYWLLLAESHLKRRLFASMVRRIELLPVPAG